MTSTNDGKDVKSNQTSAPKGKSHFIELYKSLESRLSEVSESSERTQHLCTAWSQVHTLCLHSAQSTQSHLLSWLQRHTARTILQTEWQTPKRKDDRARLESAINAFISQCNEAGEGREGFPWETQLVARGEWFKKVLDRPWDHPVLSVLLNPNGTPPTDDEVLQWLKEERGVTFVMRLHTLVGEKCEDIAVSLAAAVMERVRASALVAPDLLQLDETKDNPKASPESSFGEKLTTEAGFTPDVWELLIDIEFVLLHKRDSSRCIGLAKQTPLRSAYQLVERLQSRLELSPKEKRLWKNAKDVAVLIAQVVIARCMVVPVCTGVARGALYCCAKSLARALGPRLAPATAALAAPAASAKHLHTLAQAVDAHFAQSNDTKMKPFVCELYVRAITAGMNELERLKLKTEKESEARQMEKTLCQWFMQLGNVLNASDRIMCECTLTAFSVHPSVQMYDKIKEAPLLPNIVEQVEPKLESQSEFGSWASDSRSQTNFVKTSETLNMKSQQQANVLSTAIFNEGEALGLSPDLCQDIAVLLSGPRVKTLTWDMDREQLIEHCRVYMERTHQGTRALTTELKFLNLNPQEFMHLPEEEDDEDDMYYGIEKGYEHLVPIQDPEDIWDDLNDPERTETAEETEEKEITVSRRKTKLKPVVMTSDDEADPLSLVAEYKRIDKKKERPHSKERSKERKKKESGEVRVKEPKEKKEKKKRDKDKPEKEKKERKKKEKVPKALALANLVGLKVGKTTNHDTNETVAALGNLRSFISDSDYDSQGKSSMTSINSLESDVLFDGHFSMDELKSPEHPSNVDNMGLMKNNEFSVSNGKVGVHRPLPDQQKLMARELLNQAPLNSVSEDVKRSIYKLMDYRRQRAAMQQQDNPLSPHAFQSAKDYLNRQNPVKILNNTIQSPESKLYNALSGPSTPLQSCISPKAVPIPEIPKTIINKNHSEKLAQLKREIDNILAKKNKPIVSSSVQSPVIQYASKSTSTEPVKSFQPNQAKAIVYPPGPTQHQNSIRMKDLVTVGQERYGPYEVTKPVFAQSRPSLPVHRSPIVETPGESSYKKFLAEFQRNIDTSQTKRQIKPVSRVTPVITHEKAEPPQRAKPMPQQKKPDNSLNTFSRRSYMYKNKQADVKKASEAPQDTPRPSLESKIEDFVWQHLRSSSQDQTLSYNSLPKVSNEYAQSVNRSEMTGRPVPNSHNSTVLSHILGHTDSKHASTSTCARVTPKPVAKPVAKPVTPPKNYLSEQDQADLIKLLRQQNTFNSTPQPVQQQMHNTVAPSGHNKDYVVPTKTPTPTNKVINILSSTIIKPPSKTTATNTKPSVIPKKGVKHEIEHSKKAECKAENKKSDEISSQFQSVFNALRAQKTPSRGPNALEVALNKSSFEKAFEDSLRRNHNVVIPEKYEDQQLSNNTPKEQDNVIESAANPKNVNSKAKRRSLLKTNEQRKHSNVPPDQTKQLEIPKSNDMKTVIHKKQVNVEPKKCLTENLKKKITYVKTTEDDPFISGIRNSDYDLLEELMDDDLRKEIGELSSDEESYSAQATNLNKPGKPSDKHVTVPYNKPVEIRSKPAKSVVQSQTVKQDVCVQRPPMKCVYENKAVQGHSKPPTTPICSKIADTCPNAMSTSNVQHNTQILDYSNASTFASNHITNNANLYVSAAPQPPAQNVVLIGSNILYEGYSTVQTPIHTVTNTAYVVNSVPSMALYQPTQYVQPVINPVIIESTVPAPLISTVQYSSISVDTNALSNLINPELIHQNINNDMQASGPMNMAQQTPYEEIANKESRLSNITARNIQQNSQFQPDTVTRLCSKETTVISNNIMPKTYSAPMQPKISKLPEHVITESSELSYKREKYDNTIENIALDSQFKPDNMPNLELKTANLSEHTALSENHSKQDNKISDIMNKTIERKVLSEVQEKQILSPEKQVTSEITETKVKYQTNDYEKPMKTSQDQDRLKKKRMAIINRKISHYSEDTPIPLSYSPLSPANNSVETKSNVVEEDVSSSKFETESSESIPQDIKDNCKENKSNAAPCRRILLRSSNKLQNKVTSEEKVTKKTAQLEKVIDKTIILKDEEKPVTSKRESKRIRNKFLNKKKSPEKQQKVLKVKLNVGRKAPLKIKHKKNPRTTPIVRETQPINAVDPFDFEAQILGAKILKKQLPEQNVENSEAVCNASSKQEIVSTVTEMNTNDQQMLTNRSDKDKEELSSNTTETPEKNEIDTIQSAKIYNAITKPLTKETVHEDVKETELAADKVPKTVNKVQECHVPQLSKQNIHDDIRDNITAINLDPDAIDTSSSSVVEKQENSKSEMMDTQEDDRNVENKNDVLHSEDINTSEFKDSSVSSDDLKKVEKIQDKTDFAHDTDDNSLKKQDKEKSNTDMSETIHDKKFSNDNVETIDKTEKLKETQLDDTKLNSDNITLSEIPQSYKDSIFIEPLPSQSSDNPLKKCVRIKLPNGRAFKATVTGEISVNFDTLFDQPSLKSILINNLNCKNKYTLNVKQITTLSKHDNKVLSTHIQEVHELPKTVTTVFKQGHKVLSTQTQEVNELPKKNLDQVIDTVNLLSDDEDESQQEFETEFGKYKIQTIDTDSYNKHREKLKLRPIVIIEKKEIRPSTQVVNDPAVYNIRDLICDEKFEESGKGTEKIGFESRSNQAETMESDIDDVVLIDDSSDDDISNKGIPKKDIDKLKDNLLKDLGLSIAESNAKDNTEVLKEKLLTDLGLIIETDCKEKDKSMRAEDSKVKDSVPLISTEIPEIDLTKDSDPVEPKTPIKVKNAVVEESNNCKIIELTRQCYVKLVRCDELVKSTTSNQNKPIDQIVESKLDCPEPRLRSNSFSILDDFKLLCDVDTACTDLDRSSPVIEVFDFIASHENFVGLQPSQPEILLCDEEDDDPVLSVICNAVWFETKKTNHVLSSKLSTTVSSPLPMIDAFNDTPVVELPSLTSLTLKYLQDSDLIATLKPIRDMKFFKTLKRKSESSQSLGSPKISKPTLKAATNSDILNVSDITDPDLTDASITTVKSDESTASVETSDDVKTAIRNVLNDCISCVYSSVLDNNLSNNIHSKIQETKNTAVSAQSILHFNVQQKQRLPNNHEHGPNVLNDMSKDAILKSMSFVPEHVEYDDNIAEADVMQESILNHSEQKIEDVIAIVENALQKSTSKNPQQLGEDDDKMAELDVIQNSIVQEKVEDANGKDDNNTMTEFTNPGQIDQIDNNIAETDSEQIIEDANEAILESMSTYSRQVVDYDGDMAENDGIHESILNSAEQKIESSFEMVGNDAVQHAASKNSKQLVEVNDNMAETNGIQKPTAKTPEQKIERANDTDHNNSIQESRNSEQVAEDDDNMAEPDEIQELTSNTPEQKIEHAIATIHNNSVQELRNPEQIVSYQNNVAESDATHKPNSNTPEQKIEHTNDTVLNDSIHELRNPEQVVEDDDKAETDAIQKSNTREQNIARTGVTVQNDSLHESRNPEQIVEDDVNMAETDAIQESTLITPEQKIERACEMVHNDSIHESKNFKEVVEHDDNMAEIDAIRKSTSNAPEQKIELTNDTVLNDMIHESRNPEQIIEDDDDMAEPDAIQDSTSNTPEQNIERSSEQVVEDDDNIAKTDGIQKTISNTPKQKIEEANNSIVDDNDSVQKSINPERTVVGHDNMAETNVILKSIPNNYEENIDYAIDIIQDAMQKSEDPKTVVEYNDDMAKDAIMGSITKNPEYETGDSNDLIEIVSVQESIPEISEHNTIDNHEISVMQKSILDDEEFETMSNNKISDTDANLQPLSNNHQIESYMDNDAMQESRSIIPVHKTKDENNIASNYAVQQSTTINQESETVIEHETIDVTAIKNIAAHDTENDTTKDSIQESISSNHVEVVEDENNVTKNNEIQELKANSLENETKTQSSMDDSNAIQESMSNNTEHNIKADQEIMSNNTNNLQMDINCERDSFENEQLPSDTDVNTNMIENYANEEIIPNNNKQIEIVVPDVGQQEVSSADTKIENFESGLLILSRAAELHSNRLISESPVVIDITSTIPNIEDTITVCGSSELHEDVKWELDAKTTPKLVREDAPDKLKDTIIVTSMAVSDLAKKYYKIEEFKIEDLKPEKVSLKVLHDTIESTEKDNVKPDLNTDVTVTASVSSPATELDTRLEAINDQENSNQSSDGAIKWEMSIANADKTINEPLERNAEKIITKILKLTGKEGSELILNGIQYEDPQVGTCYMFPLIEQNDQSDQSEVNLEIPNRDEMINLIRETTDEVTNERDVINDNFQIVVPTHTYSRQSETVGEQCNLKRKKTMSDVKIQAKRYRKAKNIDYPKFTTASMSETVYVKEYTRLMDYCSTVKFSYSRPFHKEHVEVNEMLTNWPIVKAEENMNTNPDDIQENLFTDIEEQDTIVVDPREQTLAQELTSEYNENDYKPINIVETNFNMGFGEGSDRVIQYMKKTERNTSKLSAATLSDVKPHYQPYLKTETEMRNIVPEQNEENVKLRHVKFMEMREKVRIFFQKSAAELINDTQSVTKKSEDKNNFPFGLTSTEFLTPMSQEVLISVVQVGQLPVSAAAQNPVTCDPRVTHVTNVSPSQCSAENSPGDGNQTPIKTEYTELTTADITLPLVQEYAHRLQQLSSSSCQEPSQTQDSDSNCISTEIKAQIKIELTEESSQERLEDKAYEQLTSASDNNNINNGAYPYHEIPNSTTPDSHVQQNLHNAILEAMNGQSNNNNTTIDLMNGHNYNNSSIENAMNGQNLITTVKEELNESCPNNTILDNATNIRLNNTAVEGTVTNQINNNLPVSEAMNRQGQNNTTVEHSRNDQRLNNNTAKVTMNHTTMDGGMNGQIINNNIPEQVAMNESFNNISTADNMLNGQRPNKTNAEDQNNVQTLNTTVEDTINNQNGNNTVASETTNVQRIVPDPKHTNPFSEIHCNQRPDKTDQIAHAMNAAGITTDVINNSEADALVNIISQNVQSEVTTSQMTTNNLTKSTPINAMALQQALAQILPQPLNQTTVSDNGQPTPNGPPVLHIVQGSNSQTVINKQNGTPLLHIVQNKATTNGAPTSQANSFSGISLVDTGLQQGGNQLLHIVNTGGQKNNSAGQLLKRVNLLTNIANVQGNEQKMVQFVCKSADGKSIQLNAPHQRSMVLRLQPIDPSTIQTAPKPTEPVNQDVSANTGNTLNNKDASQQDIKSRSVYEENYAKFIQNGTDKPGQEKATSLPKFNQVFGKQVYQENKNEMNNDGISEHTDGQQTDNNIHLDGINDINSPPLLLRKSPPQTSQGQANLVQQIKQTIAPMNIQTMHGGVIYTRQIPVNIGGGQTINLITVPTTELVDDSNQKQQTDGKFIHQEGDHVIKIVPQSQANNVPNEENNTHVSGSNETPQNPQAQPVLTQMRIKLPMLSKTPHMVSGARVVRPSFFQIQRNVIGGANQPLYQQLVLTTAPSLGQTIRVPAQTKPAKPPESQSSPESQMSSSTLEQLREFDMVLEQVKERSTVNPGSSHSSYSNRNSSADTTDSSTVRSKSVTETTQVMYTTENNQTIASYVNRKSTVTSASTSALVRSPDSSGVVESPSSSTQSQIPHTSTSTSESTSSETPSQPKPKKKKKSSVSSSNPGMKMPPATPKPSSQKPLEDEQTTQRILYILAEYKEQVENSPDKDKPAPRRRNNLPPNLSKRKKSSSGSRRRDMSPIHGEDSCRTMGSEDSSCGTSLGECAECMESHSPQESPRKVVRKLTFEQETTQITTQTRTTTTIPQRNVIVADGQTITVARGATGKPATTVLMPANYLLPVSMVKGGQQIAIVTNRGPKLLVGGGEGGTGGTLLFQRLIGPAGLKPVLTRPGVRHIRLPTAALHNLQAFNIATHATTTQSADSTASPASAPAPPDLVDTRAMSSPWPDREAQEAAKPSGDRGSSPEGSEPWNLPSSSIADDYGYEEIVRTDNMDRTVLDAIPDRYSPDMEAQRIFDKMFDVDSKKSMYDTRCGYDIDASDTDDRPYQVVQRRDGRHHRLTHVSAAALRHKYAILEHELRLQKSLSEECEDLGVDSPSAAELFPEAELFFAPSPVHEQTIGPCHTPQPTIVNQGISQPDLDDQIATDHLLSHQDQELDINLDDVGEIVTVGEDGMTTIPLDHEEFARSHPNTTFHTEPEEGEIPPFTISQSIKGRQITFHAGRSSGTVVMAPQTTVISQATVEASGTQNTVKFTDIDNMINAMPTPQQQTNIPSSVLVKDSGLTRFDNILTDSREIHLSNTASAIVHSTGQGTQVIRRVRYDDRRDQRYMIDDPDAMIEEKTDDNRDLESMAGDDTSSPERHPELFWESNSTSERSEGRRRVDFSSDSDKCCKSPFDEASTDSIFGNHTRLDSVIKAARTDRSGSSSDDHPPLRTYPPKRVHVHHHDAERERERSVSGKTRAGESCLDIEGRRRASNRGVVKRGCHCCSGSPAPPKPKKSRQKKPTMDFTSP